MTFGLTGGLGPFDCYATIINGRSPGLLTGDSAFVPLMTRYSF